MKPALFALAGLLAASSTAAQAGNPSSDFTKATACSVSGLVVKLQGSVVLPSATVHLESADDHTRTFSGVSDFSGHFEIKGIDPGRYRLRVIRNGYVTQEYGQRTPDDPGAILALSPGQDLKDLLFRLLPSAVITGRIQNENGDPLPWVRVSALRATYVRGRRTLSSETTVVTNDLGEYRLFGLRPGRYFVTAIYQPGRRLDPGEDDEDAASTGKSGYAPTYYPNSTDPAKGVVITVKTGEEIPGADFLLEPTTVYSIRGHVTNPAARRNAGNVILALEARSTGLGWSVPSRQSLVDKPDGAFEIPDVLPGSYTLSAFWFDEAHRYQARQSVDVTNIDAEGLQLTLLSGMDIRGQINWDPRPAPDKNPLVVSVRPADTAFVYASQARVAENGTFLLHEVSEGRYLLSTFGQSPDCYLKSIRFAGMEVSDDEFNVIRGTQAVLEVTISPRGLRLLGTVTDADGLPASGVWVVLVPDDAHRSEFHRFKQTTTDQYGRYNLRGVAPGDYKLFSWEQVEQNAWQDADFLKQFEGKGQGISLQEGDGKSMDLVAIRSASREQEKQ
jgi:hypothetical protein